MSRLLLVSGVALMLGLGQISAPPPAFIPPGSGGGGGSTTPGIKSKAELEALRTDLTLTGSQIALGSLKVPGTDTMPANATITDPTNRVITLAGGTHVDFLGWNLMNWRIIDGGGGSSADVTFEHCRLGRDDTVSAANWAVDTWGAQTARYCDFIGAFKGEGTGVGLNLHFINHRNGAADQIIEYGRFRGHKTDAVKLTRGRLVGCYFDPIVTVDRTPVVNDPGAAYATGTLVTQPGGSGGIYSAHVWRAKVANAPGSELSATSYAKTGTTSWTYINPHADQMTVPSTSGEVLIQGNYFNDEETLRAYPIGWAARNGHNNLTRIGGSGITMTALVTTRNNLMRFDSLNISVPIQVTDQNGTGYVPPIIDYNHIITPTGGRPIYNYNVANNNVVWYSNWKDDGSEWGLPQGATLGTPIQTSQVRRVWLSGQSEFDRVIQADTSNSPTKPTLLADNVVKFIYHDSSTRALVSKQAVASDGSLTGGMIAFANYLIQAGNAGDTWEVVWHSYSGQGWAVPLSDSSIWPWSAVQELCSAMSGPPTIHFQSWLSANRALALSYATVYEQVFAGTSAGVPLSAPYNPQTLSGSAYGTVDHIWTDAFSTSETTFVLGQHKFDVRQTNSDANTITSGGGTDWTSFNIERCRRSVDDFFGGSPVAGTRKGVEICSYLNGYWNGTSWTDESHPGARSADGILRWASCLAYGVCEALGLSPAQPTIDTVVWATDKVTISSSAGPITNVFAMRSESQLGTTHAHWTEAVGFEINGIPAERAELVGGAIHLYYGDGTQQFIDTDTIEFLPGGAGGHLVKPDDYQAGLWKAVPGVDLGLPDVGFMNLRPELDFMTKFPNTLSNTTR